MRFADLSLSAQTAFAELSEQVHSDELQLALSGFPGSFHKRSIKGCDYWYFGYRDLHGKGRMAYVGPDSTRVHIGPKANALRMLTSPMPAGMCQLRCQTICS